MPMGLGGAVREIATEQLQPGDRVLFYTDGVTESRSPDGEPFGLDRLADLTVRASHGAELPAETVRRSRSLDPRLQRRPAQRRRHPVLLEYHGSA